MTNFAFQQSAFTAALGSAAPSFTFNFTPIASGDLVLVMVQVASPTLHPISVTDSALNPFAQRGSLIVTGSSSFTIWELANCASTTNIIVTLNANSNLFMMALEYSFAQPGYAFQNEFQSAISAPGTGANAITFTGSNVSPTALVVGLVGEAGASNNALSSGTGWTQRARLSGSGGPGFLIEDLEQSGAAGPITLNATTTAGSDAYGAWMLSYTEVTPPVPYPPMLKGGIGVQMAQ